MFFNISWNVCGRRRKSIPESLRNKIILVLIILNLIGIPNVYAKKKENIFELKEQLKKKKADLKYVEKNERSIIDTLNKIDKKLDKKRGELNIYLFNLNKTNEKLQKIEKNLKEFMSHMIKRKHLLVKRLRAINEYSQYGFVRFLFQAESLTDLYHKYILAKYLIKYDKILLTQYKTDIEKINTKQIELKGYYNRVKYYQNQVLEQERRLELQQQDREILLKSVRQSKDKQNQLIRDLEKRSKKLNKIIDTYDNKGKYKDKTDFHSLKGELISPVKGKIFIEFGQQIDSQFGAGILNKGITIKSHLGEPIFVVSSGKIIYADWFSGYGKLIIVDHGDGYCTVYAHLLDIFVKKGDIVSSRYKIASLGNTGSIRGNELYFEIRYKSKPLDPKEWLKSKKGM